MGRKKELKEVDRAARESGLSPEQRRDLKHFLERCKREGDGGNKNDRGDFTYDELLEKIREYKEGMR